MLKKQLAGMSLEEKVGQLFQIGFVGQKVTPEIKEMIETYHIGGIIYFRRNIESPEQLARLSGELQQLAVNTRQGLPLIISTDQEGGIVTRLIGATHFPGNMTIGAADDQELSFRAGRAVARELKYSGINMNLAPVLDVNNNPDNPVIGVRSFGGDPGLVARLGTAFIKGMQQEGVSACGKHFPGHGDTATDSHLDLPVINHPRERLEKIEFYPFKEAIKQGMDTIMIAHVYFPAIEDEKNIPATLSYNVITKLLREGLDFKGLIMTDCMEMQAIQKTFGTVEGAVMAVEAGADQILISHSLQKQKRAIAAVVEAVREGRISRERIDNSVIRVLRLKERWTGIEKALFKQTAFSRQEGEKLAYQIARRGVTLVKNEESIIPVNCKKSDKMKVLIIDFNTGKLSMVEDNGGDENSLFNFLEAEGLQVERTSLTKGENALPDLKKFDLLIICTSDAVRDKYQISIVNELNLKEIPLIVLAVRNPYDLKALPGITTFLTGYDYSPANIKVAVEIIIGKHKAQGRLPVDLE